MFQGFWGARKVEFESLRVELFCSVLEVWDIDANKNFVKMRNAPSLEPRRVLSKGALVWCVVVKPYCYVCLYAGRCGEIQDWTQFANIMHAIVAPLFVIPTTLSPTKFLDGQYGIEQWIPTVSFIYQKQYPISIFQVCHSLAL